MTKPLQFITLSFDTTVLVGAAFPMVRLGAPPFVFPERSRIYGVTLSGQMEINIVSADPGGVFLLVNTTSVTASIDRSTNVIGSLVIAANGQQQGGNAAVDINFGDTFIVNSGTPIALYYMWNQPVLNQFVGVATIRYSII